MTVPEVHYARSGDVHIAFQVFGEGDLDLVVVPGFFSHLEVAWSAEGWARFMRGLGSFARVIIFDRRGSGLSDPVEGAPTLEERMDDVRAVMDAAGSERAALLGLSEGVPMSILFAATYPERVRALVCYGGMARSTTAEDYGWGKSREEFMEAHVELVHPLWGQGATIEVAVPSHADDPVLRAYYGRMERASTSPGMLVRLALLFFDTDVRAAAQAVHVPTLIVHRTRDRLVNVGNARWLAANMPDARLIEMPGDDHPFFYEGADVVLAETQEFLTGTRPAPKVDRVLATVLFTDIVDSTRAATLAGDARWRSILAHHQDQAGASITRAGGRVVKWTGDGMLATFDGPVRAVRCAQEVLADADASGLQLRAGLHTGEVEVMGEDIAGLGVHIAARVSAVAGAGEVLVSRTVKDLVVGSQLAFTSRGPHALKGLDEPWELFAVEA